MYSKNATKSYGRGTTPKRSYKRNVLPVGVTDLTSSLLGSKVMSDASDLFRRGKKSKLAKALRSKRNPKADIPYQYDVSTDYLGQLIWAHRDEGDKYSAGTWYKKPYRNANNLYIELSSKYGAKFAKQVISEYGLDIHRKDNPEPISPEVEDMSKEWHGRGVRDYETVEETETYDKDLVNLGLLEELGVLELGLITFKKNQPILACDGEGHNLEVIGGDQRLDLDREGIELNGKRLIPLGYIYSIVYITDKHHLEGSNGYPEPYEHYFAEEFYKSKLDPNDFKETSTWFEELEDMGMVDKAVAEGRLPLAVYDKTDEKIIISGGGYEVTDLGIKD